MPFNGAGVFTRVYQWVNDAANGIFVDATRTDTDSNDIATGLTNCVTRDGQSAWTANLPAGGFKVTGLASGSAASDSVNYGQVFNSPAFVTPTATTSPALGDNSLLLATTAFVAQQAFSTALPAQTGKNGRVIGTNGTTASWVSKLPTVQVFTVSGTWVATTDTVKVTVIGGGGSSGTSNVNAASGGAAGGTAIKTLSGLTIGATYTVTVGLGGAAVSGAAANGNAGGTSSFSGTGITTVSATGGGKGNSGANSDAGGVGSGGDIHIPGGTSAELVAGLGNYGCGGASFLSPGGAPGSVGVGYGAGAGGVYGTSTGLAGADGVVILEY